MERQRTITHGPTLHTRDEKLHAQLLISVFANTHTTQAPTGKGAATRRRVKALYTFEVQEAGELGFKAGDVITLLEDSHPDWWKGRQKRRSFDVSALFGCGGSSLVPMFCEKLTL